MSEYKWKTCQNCVFSIADNRNKNAFCFVKNLQVKMSDSACQFFTLYEKPLFVVQCNRNSETWEYKEYMMDW